MQYQEQVSEKLTSMLAALTPDDRASEMDECEAAANGYLNASPRRDSASLFSQDLLSAPGMSDLVTKDGTNGKLAMSAETPSELVMNLLPSDGHLN